MFKLEQQIVLNDNFESSIPSNNPWKQLHSNLFQQTLEICGQSYKHFIRVNYDTRQHTDWKIDNCVTNNNRATEGPERAPQLMDSSHTKDPRYLQACLQYISSSALIQWKIQLYDFRYLIEAVPSK